MDVLAQALAMNSLSALATFLGIDPAKVTLGAPIYNAEFNDYVFKAVIGTAGYRIRVTLAQNPGGGVPPQPIFDVAMRQVS